MRAYYDSCELLLQLCFAPNLNLSVQFADQKARRVVENHAVDGDWRLESLVTMEACLSSREEKVMLAVRRGPSDLRKPVIS